MKNRSELLYGTQNVYGHISCNSGPTYNPHYNSTFIDNNVQKVDLVIEKLKSYAEVSACKHSPYNCFHHRAIPHWCCDCMSAFSCI